MSAYYSMMKSTKIPGVFTFSRAMVPVGMFPDIKRLISKQRDEWMILDDQYFTFEHDSRIYSVKDVLHV